jgi:hypothetical protein
MFETIKFDYSDQTLLKLLSDSIARVSNCFYGKDTNEKAKVISLFLDAHYVNDSKTIFMNQKYKLNKIYFSQKGKALKQNQKVFDIIIYCFNKTDSFISKNNKEMIL